MSLTSYRAAPPRDAFLRFVVRVASRLVLFCRLCLDGFQPAMLVDRGNNVLRSVVFFHRYREDVLLVRFGGDLLSHVLRRSTIGVLALNGRVRDGIGCFTSTMTTKPKKKHGGFLPAVTSVYL
jgi:hypothetical protein